jgi:ABC-2 type transport system ATP-binding protein
LALIVTEGLTRGYGKRPGIMDLNLSVEEGSLFGFLGPNGAGKTTTIRVLLGFLRPGAGRARISDLDCFRDSHRIKAEVGYLPGDVRLYPWMTGDLALRLFGRVRGRDLRAAGGELGEDLELDLGVKVREMSRGMRQKLGLILTLAPNPRLLILDEPTSGLDPLTQEKLRRRLRDLTRAGHTVFFSSHVLREVEELCDRVAIVRAGRLVVEEGIEALRAKAAREVEIRFRGGEIPNGLELPPFLKAGTRGRETFHGRLEGPVAPLLEWLAGKPVEDLSIERPDLESLFRTYYTSPEGEA